MSIYRNDRGMQLYIKYGRFPKQGAVVKMFSQDNMEQVELATEAIDKYIEYRENKSFQKSLLCELCHCISIGIRESTAIKIIDFKRERSFPSFIFSLIFENVFEVRFFALLNLPPPFSEGLSN